MPIKENLILVVDDETEIQRLFLQRFRRRIKAKELDFCFASSGLEALKILEEHNSISMILTDIRMPEMDGITLISKLADIDKNLKTIVVSAYGDMTNIRMAMNYGAFDFVTKPIDFKDLEITIDKTLAFVHDLRLQQQKLERALEEIRERELKEIALAHAKELSESANIAKSAFLAGISHEIRTPMNGVLGMADLLANTNLTTEQRDYVRVIRDSGDALLAIINDILDFSTIESGMLKIENRIFVLENVIKSVCEFLSRQAIAKNINLQYAIHPDTPKVLLSDNARLRQILLNLVGNAIKFTPQGNVTISINSQISSTSPQNNYKLIFAIQDTGIGISEDHLNLLFQPFSQADSSISRKYGGTGLGLVISKRLVELMGGTIWVESLGQIGGNPPPNWESKLENLPSQGSIFYFTVTIEANSLSPKSLSKSLHNNSNISSIVSSPTSSDNLRILIAEDNPVNQKILALFLERMGYKPDVANNGLEVLESLKDKAYDLIFMDMQMPEMDGITATRRIRQDAKQNPWIVALTANALPEDRKLCLEAGMNDFTTKPIQLENIQRIFTQYRANLLLSSLASKE